VTPPHPLAFEGVSRWYAQVIGVNDVTIALTPGVTGLLGPNGAGKSTFLTLASGRLAPNLGAVRVFGHDPRQETSVLTRVGLCPDVDGLRAEQTGLAFVTSLLRLQGYSGSKGRACAQDALHLVGLEEVAARTIGGYSRGMRQRLKLAQALAHDPDLLLLDEPLSGLDPMHRQRVIELVKERGRAGKTVLISSHVLREVETMTSRIVLLNKGHLVADGTVSEIRRLLDLHPHKVRVRALRARPLAAMLMSQSSLSAAEIEGDDGWVTLRTRDLGSLSQALQDQAEEYGVCEVYPADDDLQSVFQYLVAR
jgi:ABC-2 type transport system ATP-binding protein